MHTHMTMAILCLIVCHEGPADHFAAYAKVLTQRGYEVRVHAAGSASKKLHERGIEVVHPFCLDDLTQDEEERLASEIAKTCSAASMVITDVGHTFDILLQRALNNHATKAVRLAYYDNPESFVPGGYSVTASAVMQLAEGVLCANANLAESGLDCAYFPCKPRRGIGYYPLSRAKEISERRKTDQALLRSLFFMRNGIQEKGQKVCVYFGGNNEEYFSKAFPAFLSFVLQATQQADLSNTIIVMQQHPGAKIKNQDGRQLALWLEDVGTRSAMPQLILSDFSADEAQLIADAALYYQTSMAAQFMLAGIPTIQIGHEIYEDILVKSRAALTVNSPLELVDALVNFEKTNKPPVRDFLDCLGFKEDWPQRLENELFLQFCHPR